MCLYLELFWSVFSRIDTEYGEIRRDLVSMSLIYFGTLKTGPSQDLVKELVIVINCV